MANLSEEQLKQLGELLDKSLNPSVKGLADTIENLNTTANEGIKLDKLALSAERRAQEDEKIIRNRQNQVLRAYTAKINEINEQVKKGDITRAEAQQNIIAIRDKAAESIKNPELRQAFEAQAKAIERNAKITNMISSEFAQSAKQNIVAGLKNVSASFVDIMRSYQSGSSQIGLATSVLQNGVSLAGQGIQGAGSAIGAAGSAMSTASNKYAKGIGAALSLVGPAVSMFGSAASKVAGTVIPFLSTELENQIQNFQSLNKSGVTLGGGLTELRAVAHQARLPLESLSNIVKANTESLAIMGGGVTGGTKKLAAALDTGGMDFRKRLLNLGFSIEEQGGIVADVALDMRRAGADMSKITPKELIDRADSLAKNYKVISDITGQDAKKLREKANVELQQVGVRAEMQKRMRAGDEGVAARFGVLQTMAASAGPLFNDVVRQLLGQGQLMGETAKNFSVFGPAATDFQQTVLDIKNDPSLSPEEQTKRMNDAYAKFNAAASAPEMQGMLQTLGAGIETGSSSLAGLARAVGEAITGTDKFTIDGAKKAADSAAALAETQDKLTGQMNSAVIAANDFKVTIQDKILNEKVLEKFAEYTGKATTELSNMVDTFAGVVKSKLSGESSFSLKDLTSDTITKVAAGIVATGILGSVLGSAFGGPKGPTPPPPPPPTPPVPPTAGPTAPTGAAPATGPAAKTAGGVAKAAGKSLVKFIPGVGLVMSAIGAGSRAMAGDLSGAALELGSGVAGLVPGVGTAAAIGMQGTLAAKDLGVFDGKKPEEPPTTATPSMPKESNLPTSLTNVDEIAKAIAIKTEAGVTLNSTEAQVAKMLEEMSIEAKRSAGENLTNTQEMTAYLRSMNEQFSNMQRYMESIVTNTERTARGVA